MDKNENKISADFERLADIGEHRIIADTDDCFMIRLENETGEGDMIIYRVFDGIYLMYNDFHMAYYNSDYQAIKTMLAIDYCREGNLTMESDNGLCQIKKAGNICIDSRRHHAGTVSFPGSHFHGITVGFEEKTAQQSLDMSFPCIPLNIAEVRDKFCGKDGFFIIKAEETLKRIFTELYHVPESVRNDYFRLKVVELLLCLSVIEPQNITEDKAYFYKDQIEKAGAVMRLITEDLKVDYSIAELAECFDISESTLKSCFKNLYGEPIYTWLKGYRIQKAAEMLISDREKSIGDIAFEVGYESPSKFSAAFKSICKMTPKEYRNQPH